MISLFQGRYRPQSRNFRSHPVERCSAKGGDESVKTTIRESESERATSDFKGWLFSIDDNYAWHVNRELSRFS